MRGLAALALIVGMTASQHAAYGEVTNLDSNLSNAGLDAGIRTEDAGHHAAHRGHGPFHIERTYRAGSYGNCTDRIREVVWRVWDDGRRDLVYSGCIRPRVPGAAVPPSVQQVRNAVGIPSPVIGVNPHQVGLTGLATYLWYVGPTTKAVTVTLNGFAVTAEAHAVSYHWTTGDGGDYVSSAPGSEASPSATHVYRYKGDW